MAKKQSGKKAKSLEQIEQLKAKRRVCLLKILVAAIVIILVILARPSLQVAGIIPETDMISSGIQMLAGVALAAFAGFAGLDYSKAGNEITRLCNQYDISKEDIRSYEGK